MVRKARGKYLLVAERLSNRIRSGDYHVHGVPAERELATQVGVSYTTVRKATQHLLDAGLLCRQPNGRLAVANGAEPGGARRQIALLAPAVESNEVNLWSISLARLQARFDYSTKVVHYGHWDDPNILAAVEQFDASFLLPPNAPDEFATALAKTGRRLVVLNRDWSALGFRSLRMFPPHFIHKLLDHLADLGHRRIDCVSTQHAGPVMREWIMQWQIWRAAQMVEGELVEQVGDDETSPLVAAYQVVYRRIAAGMLAPAMLCLTEAAAIGASRAMLDHGLRPGRDAAIVTVGFERCEYLSPSLTTLEQPDPLPYLTTCLEWALGRSDTWYGPLLLQPPDLKLMVRESTVPDIDYKNPPERLRRIGRTR